MTFPAELKYTKDHEWVKIEGNIATVGITSFALEQLGDVVHLELPEAGEEFDEGDSFGTVESTKTVSDLYMPVTGAIKDVNNDLLDELEVLSDSTYDKGWFVKIEIKKPSDELLTASEYQKLVDDE